MIPKVTENKSEKYVHKAHQNCNQIFLSKWRHIKKMIHEWKEQYKFELINFINEVLELKKLERKNHFRNIIN